jgi:hypothetical protein
MAEIVFVTFDGKQIGLDLRDLDTIARGASITFIGDSLNERVDALEIYTSDECCLRFIGSPALRLEVIDYGTIRERDRINIFDSKTDDGQAGSQRRKLNGVFTRCASCMH